MPQSFNFICHLETKHYTKWQPGYLYTGWNRCPGQRDGIALMGHFYEPVIHHYVVIVLGFMNHCPRWCFSFSNCCYFSIFQGDAIACLLKWISPTEIAGTREIKSHLWLAYPWTHCPLRMLQDVFLKALIKSILIHCHKTLNLLSPNTAVYDHQGVFKCCLTDKWMSLVRSDIYWRRLSRVGGEVKGEKLRQEKGVGGGRKGSAVLLQVLHHLCHLPRVA